MAGNVVKLAKIGPRRKSLFAVVIAYWLAVTGTSGQRFTKSPPVLQYVLQGTDAIFNWDYDISAPLLVGTWGVQDSGKYCIAKDQSSTSIVCSKYSLKGKATMILQNVLVNMTAEYFCNLIFDAPSFAKLNNATRLIVVKKIPTFVKPPSPDKTGIEGGSDVTITAEIEGDVSPIVSWYRNGIPANASMFPVSSKALGSNSNGNKVVQSNLTIKAPARNSGGTFLVKAVYGVSSPESNSSVSINIWYGPENVKMSSSKSGMGLSLGQTVTIICSAVSYPASRFTIYRNNTVVLASSTSGSMTITSFSKNDAGNYSCVAENEVNNVTVDGVWFAFIAEVITTTTAKPSSTSSIGTHLISTSTSSTSTPNTSASPIERTGADDSLPWWVWLAIALAVVLVICIPLIIFFCIRRRRSKKNSQKPAAMQFSKAGFDIDSYIKSTTYSRGYEENIEKKEPLENGRAMDGSFTEVDAGKANLGVRFESEHDLIEHCRKGPEKEDYDDYDDDDFKSHDPFEDDQGTDSNDPFDTESKDPYAFDNDVYEQDDDMYKVNSESEKGDKEPELFDKVHQDFIQYEI